jgi:hypothetical protein
MSLLTFPFGLDEVSVVQSIGEYIIKKVPEKWVRQEDHYKERVKDVNSVIIRWR